MNTSCVVFFVDDEEYMRLSAEQALTLAGLNVKTYATARQALTSITPDWSGVLITDMTMPDMDGLALMSKTLKIDKQIPVILISGKADISIAVSAIKNGAYDFLEKPYSAEQLVEVTNRAMVMRSLVMDNRALRMELAQQRIESPILGRSRAIQELNESLHAIAETDADVLICGETGTGKELVASTLHQFSNRNAERFVAINCGAMPEALFESELFGHMKGSFTSADVNQTGKMEFASGGTFFLDEIESMPLALQVKLLRVLQERKLQRLGSNQDIELDLRIVAATKTDLLQASNNGNFRVDLFYRLNVINVNIPPLRDRKEDLPILFQHFHDKAIERMGKKVTPVDDEVFNALFQHDWPGNVRELKNYVERVALGIQPDLKPGAVFSHLPLNMTLANQVDNYEKLAIERELSKQAGNITRTYESLGISRKTLYDKMKKYGISKEASRAQFQ